MSRSGAIYWHVLWVGWLLLAGTALAQNTNASLRGTVTDSSNAVLRGAQVSISDQQNGFNLHRVVDSQGDYEFTQLPPGEYLVSVEAAGFSTQSKSIALVIDQQATLSFSLAVQSLTTNVTVSAQTSELNTSDATMGNALDSIAIQALPVEGDIPDLLSLQPGVLYLGLHNDQSHDSRSGSSAGARSDQNNSTLDGLDNNDQARGYAFTGVLRSTLDSVQEFRVTSAGYNADTGRSSGAQINILTKSGTNQFHGSVYGRTRDLIPPANDWFNKQAELEQGLPNVPGALDRNTYGASLGGPLVKNKLFFFTTYEGEKINENQQMTMIVPTASLRAGEIKYPSTQNGVTQIVTLNSGQIASMDPNCTTTGTCPWGPGVDPNSLAVFKQYPLPNGYLRRRRTEHRLPTHGRRPTRHRSILSSLNWITRSPVVTGYLCAAICKRTARPEFRNFPGRRPVSPIRTTAKGLLPG